MYIKIVKNPVFLSSTGSIKHTVIGCEAYLVSVSNKMEDVLEHGNKADIQV